MIKKRLLGFMSFCVALPWHALRPRFGSTTPTDVDRVKGLQALYQLPAGTHVRHCDLSHSRLTKMPNLSMYTIRYPSTSRTMRCKRLPNCNSPEDVVVLDLSHNQIGAKEKEAEVRFHNEIFPRLTTLDIFSHKIFSLLYPLRLQHLNVSHNVLRYLRVNATSWQNNLQSLDISHNWHFRWPLLLRLQAHPHLKRDSCAQGREFVFVERSDVTLIHERGAH